MCKIRIYLMQESRLTSSASANRATFRSWTQFPVPADETQELDQECFMVNLPYKKQDQYCSAGVKRALVGERGRVRERESRLCTLIKVDRNSSWSSTYKTTKLQYISFGPTWEIKSSNCSVGEHHFSDGANTGIFYLVFSQRLLKSGKME